jgi:hypothetical protein
MSVAAGSGAVGNRAQKWPPGIPAEIVEGRVNLPASEFHMSWLKAALICRQKCSDSRI